MCSFSSFSCQTACYVNIFPKFYTLNVFPSLCKTNFMEGQEGDHTVNSAKT